MRLKRTGRALVAATAFIAGSCTAMQAQNLKALQFTSTQKDVWQVKRAEVSTVHSGTPQVVFSTGDVVSTFQAWGTCFNELDWYAVQRLKPEAQQEYFERMFSPDGDLRFALGRIPVGASDYAGPENFYDPSVFHQRDEAINLKESWYSCDEMPVGETDFTMEHFTIERDRRHIIPFIRKAQEQNPDMKFWCSPWSPPQWMKHSHHYSNRAGYGNGLDTTYPTYTSTQFIMEPDYLQALALYFSKFIEAYGEEGIPITGLCYQNEAYTCNYYPNTSWKPTDSAIFNGDYLIPFMRKHHPEVKIWLGTMNTNHVDDVFEVILNYQSKNSDPAFQGKKLSELFDGIGFQWEGRDAIGEMRRRYPALEFIQTESECGNGTFDWGAGSHTFELIHHYLNNGCVTYTNWNSILGGNGRGPFMNWWQNGLLHLDINKGVAYYTPEFYAYKHYSHFIGNGTKILKKTSSLPLVLAAQRPDGLVVVVVGNEGGSRRSLTFAVDDRYMSVTVPANSYNTFVIGEEEAIEKMAAEEGLTEEDEEVTDCTSLIRNAAFSSLSGWTKDNAGEVDASVMNVLGQQAYNSFSTSFTSMDVHQDIEGLPAGEYFVSCRSVCGEGLITDQHAYIIGYADDPQTSTNRAESPVKQNDSWDMLSWEKQTTGHVTISEGQNLRIGYASTSQGGQSGWFAVTDFQLFRVGKAEESDDDGQAFYLYNVGQKKYVNIGYGSYGTQMGLDDMGLEFTLVPAGSGQYYLKTSTLGDDSHYGWLDVAPNSSVALPSGIDAQYYLNSTTSMERITFEAVDVQGTKDVYALRFPDNGNKYLAYDPAYPTIVWLSTNGSTDNARWQLVTRKERLQSLKDTGSGDASFMIQNADFFHDCTTGWEGFYYNGTTDNNTGNWDSGNHIEGSDWRGMFHKLDATFHLSQIIKGLPAGNYTFSCNGFYKPQSNTDHTTVNAFLFAQNKETPLQHAHNGKVKSRLFPSDTSMERAYTIDGETYYQPEWYKTDAVLRYFDDGIYLNSINFDYDGTAPLLIGVKDDAGGTQTWAEISNFRLTYNGSTQTGINTVRNGNRSETVYSLDGRKLSSPQKGINILSDKGRTQIVVIKR